MTHSKSLLLLLFIPCLFCCKDASKEGQTPTLHSFKYDEAKRQLEQYADTPDSIYRYFYSYLCTAKSQRKEEEANELIDSLNRISIKNGKKLLSNADLYLSEAFLKSSYNCNRDSIIALCDTAMVALLADDRLKGNVTNVDEDLTVKIQAVRYNLLSYCYNILSVEKERIITSTDRCLELLEHLEVIESRSFAYSMRGWAYFRDSDISQCLLNYKKGQEEAHKFGDKIVEAICDAGAAYAFMKYGFEDTSKTLFLHAYSLLDGSNYLEHLSEFSFGLAQLYESQHNADSALIFYKKTSEYAELCNNVFLKHQVDSAINSIEAVGCYSNDSVLQRDFSNEQVAKYFDNLRCSYNNANSGINIEEKKSTDIISYVACSIFALLMLVLFLYLLNKQKKLMAEKERHLIKENGIIVEALDQKCKQTVKQLNEVETILFESTLNTEELYKSPSVFFKKFHLQHPNYQNVFCDNCPNATQHDLELSILIVLNIKKEDILGYLNITENSLKIARWRLRKKLSLHHNESLEAKLSELLTSR